MRVVQIHYTTSFEKQFHVLPKIIQGKAIKTEKIFRHNPFHSSLRLHKLKGKLDGLWTISLDYKYRIVFKSFDDGVILFFSIGLHAIYD